MSTNRNPPPAREVGLPISERRLASLTTAESIVAFDGGYNPLRGAETQFSCDRWCVVRHRYRFCGGLRRCERSMGFRTRVHRPWHSHS